MARPMMDHQERDYMNGANEAARSMLERYWPLAEATGTDPESITEAILAASDYGSGVLHELAKFTAIAVMEAAERQGHDWSEQFRSVRHAVDGHQREMRTGIEVAAWGGDPTADWTDAQARAVALVLALWEDFQRQTPEAGKTLQQELDDAADPEERFVVVCFPALDLAMSAIVARGAIFDVPFDDCLREFLAQIPVPAYDAQSRGGER